ncbi:helix-turn-helix transcriptional regulator [Streptomyces sp. enrichment culture]|uniref:helix-turn-helix transcriptional regulator n=1 Tax=Streptomyces sp. enrichment culture TaxID=1795815 RepID=UPI003F556592
MASSEAGETKGGLQMSRESGEDAAPAGAVRGDASRRARAETHRPLPRLRGRDRERALLSAALDAACRGQGAVVVLEGAPGSGKTRLVEEAHALAENRSMRVFAGGGEPEGQAVPLRPVLRAFASENDPLLDARILTELGELPDQGYWILQEIQERLELAALAAPLLVTVDDVQWCDETTLLALRNLPERLAAYPIVWLLSVRSSAVEGPVGTTMARLTRTGAERVRLGPLGADAVKGIAQDVLGGEPGPELLAAAAQAEGRPLLLRELFEGLRDEGGVAVRAGRTILTSKRVPERFQASVRRRLSQLSGQAREVVQVASVLGRTLSAELIADLLGLPPGALVRPVREALAAELLVDRDGRLAFPHDLVREAVANGLPPARRRRLQRRAVDLRLARGVPVADVAVLLLDSSEPGDRDAVLLLRRAAAELASRAPAVAAELSSQALRLLPEDDDDRPALVAETVSLLWRGGDSVRASALAESAFEELDSLPPQTEAQLRLELAGLASQHSFTEAIRQGRLGVAVRSAPPALRALSQGLLALNLTRGGTLDEADEVAERALALGRETGQVAAQAVALTSRSIVAFMRADWRGAFDLIEQATVLADRADPAELPYGPPVWRMHLDSCSGDSSASVEAANAGIRLAKRFGQAATLHFWSMMRARAYLEDGRLEEARAETEGAEAMAEELGPGNFADATIRYVLGVVAVHHDDRRAARKAAREAELMMENESAFIQRIGTWLAAQIAEWEGDSKRALELMPRSTELFDTVHPRCSVPFDPVDQATFIRIALRAGDRERAAEVADVAQRRADISPGFPALTAAAAHTRGLLNGDAALLVRATELYEGSGRRLAVASAHEDAGRALLRDGARQTGTAQLERALRLYEEVDAEWDAARVRRRLRSSGTGTAVSATRGRRQKSGWSSLSPGERRVARLVADGATNREVAEKLFLSPHTVSTYVRRSFKKLGISSRVELVGIILSQEAEGGTAQ